MWCSRDNQCKKTASKQFKKTTTSILKEIKIVKGTVA